MGALLSLKSITRTFVLGDTDVAALNAVSLDIRHGEFVAIMGQYWITIPISCPVVSNKESQSHGLS